MDTDCTRASEILKRELAEASPNLIEQLSELSADELASLFVSGAFFQSILQPLIDQDWLRHQSGEQDTRAVQMKNELQGLSFLEDKIVSATPQELKAHLKRTANLNKAVITFVRAQPLDRFRDFATAAMKRMDQRARAQDLFAHNQFTEAMYRAFDQMDEILGIRYELDRGMNSDPTQPERLYEGAGIGVQTSYSSILLALDRAQVPQGARVLDLGSGYGRVGFVLGLLRPDVSFTGYEYVDHRVQDSKAVAAKAGLANVDFETQDLSHFDLPRADVYYMYDPFSRETYAYVLNQLIAIGRTDPVTIITKGRANTWVRDALEEHGWSIDETCDSGTVWLFRSPPLSQSETLSTFV